MENNYCGMYKTSASKFIPHDIHIKLHIELIFFLYKLNIRELIIYCSQSNKQKLGHRVFKFNNLARFQSCISLPLQCVASFRIQISAIVRIFIYLHYVTK